jgi:hypothetical protein
MAIRQLDRQRDRALIRTIRQKLLIDAPSILQLESDDLGVPKNFIPQVVSEVEEFPGANRHMCASATFQVIKEAPGLPNISLATICTIWRSLGFFYLPSIPMFPYNIAN